MTGAGSATVAYCLEDNYGAGPPTDPTWIQPGIDISASEASLEHALERVRQPDDPTPAGSREGPFEGALSVSWTVTGTEFHDLVFADGGTALPHSPMAAPSSTWHLGVDLPDGTTKPRAPMGVIVTEASINYEQGGDISAELTMLYGDESNDITAPSTIQQPSDDDVYSWHGTSLQISGVSQSLLQSASLSLSGLARFRRGQSRKPFDAVVDAISPSLSTTATFTEDDQQQASYGGSGTAVQDTVDKVSGVLTFENGQGNTIEYTLSGLQPANYGWSDLVTPDTDLSEPVEWHIADVEAA